jgi:hypothetical protein
MRYTYTALIKSGILIFFKVWIGLALAFVLVVITLLCFKEYILRTKQPSSCSSNTKTNHSDQYSYFKYMTNSNIFLYVIGTLLNQGKGIDSI